MSEIIFDEKATLRFKGNQIIKDIIDKKIPPDINFIVMRFQCDQYSENDYWEFMELIGYSIDGYQSLRYSHYERINKKVEDE